MSERKWERLAALSGLVFAVVLVVGIVVGGKPPRVDASPGSIAAFVSAHHRAMKVGSLLSGLAIIFALWFLGSLFGFMRKAEGDRARLSVVAVTSGTLMGAAALIGSTLQAFVASQGGAAAASGAFVLSGLVFGAIWFPGVALAGAVATLGGRTKALPSWHVGLSTVAAVVFLVASFAGVKTSGPLAQFGPISFVALILFAVWIAATSLVVYSKTT